MTIRTASTKRKMVKTWFIRVTGDLNFNFASVMELLRDNWEIIQLQSIFPSPLQNILSIACRTLWSLLFTMPLECLKIDALQSEFITFILIQYPILSDTTPLSQFSLRIYLHNIINTSQGGLEQDRKNNLSCLITLNLWLFCVHLPWQWLRVSFCMHLPWQWPWVSRQWNAAHQHGYLWLWEEAGYDVMRKGTGKKKNAKASSHTRQRFWIGDLSAIWWRMSAWVVTNYY